MMSTVSKGSKEDCAVGTFIAGAEKQFLPVAPIELERAQHFVSRMLSTFHFRTGGDFLVVSLYDSFVQFMPLERAASDAGFVACNADDSFFDASRVESIMRRFDVKAVAAISKNCLDGLENLGFDIHQVFGDAVVWAYPDACHRLTDSGATVRQFATIGPAIAMECAEGKGLHIDRLEWDIDARDGELLLTSKMPRATQFNQFATGMRGEIAQDICTCGNADWRIHLTD